MSLSTTPRPIPPRSLPCGGAARRHSAVRAAAAVAARIRAAMPGPLRWLTADPRRVLWLAWLVGLLLVGGAGAAHADGIIVGPDLSHGGPKTLFETYDFITYELTVKPDDDNSGFLGLGAALLNVIGFVNNLILWACLALLYGALTLLEWFLNLTIYRDSAPQIDAATRVIADGVFWPLIAATVAVGAFIAYARWRGEGRGFLTDLGWVVASATLAVGFAAGPSQLMNQVDSVRQDLASNVINGSARFATSNGNPVGFTTPPIGGSPQEASTRTLVDSVWNTFGATTWCFAQFHDLDICKVAGAHALADDDQWKAWMQVLDNNGAVPEFGAYGDWVRGQDPARTGYLLLLALITIPTAALLLRLVIAGMVAVLGFLLMLMLGLVFLAFLPIPGWFRQTGVRYWIYTLGLQAQALFITMLISGVMVVSAIISTQVGTYGFFIVAVLNLALFFAAVRARAWLEMLTTSGGAGAMGFGSVLIARSVLRTVVGGAASVLGTGTGLAADGARRLGRFADRHSQGPGWGAVAGAGRRDSWWERTVRTPRAGLDTDPPPVWADATRTRTPSGATPITPPQPAALAAPGTPALPSASNSSRRASTPRPTPGPGSAPRSDGGLRPGSGPGSGHGSGPGGPPAGSGRGPRRGRWTAPGRGDEPLPPRSRPGAAATRPSSPDPSLGSNVARAQGQAGTKGRVWVFRPGEGLSSLDTTPPPRIAPRKGGTFRITTARRGPRGGGGKQ